MARNCYPVLTLGGLTPTAYWDFCSSADTAGQGRGYTPVAWTHLTGADLDTGGTPTCVTPAMYYARSSDLTSELSKQDAALFTSSAATWFLQMWPDGALEVLFDCALQKSTPGGSGNSRNGFVAGIDYGNNAFVHLKPDAETQVTASVAVSGGVVDRLICMAFSFNTSNFRISANGSSSGENTTPTGYSVTADEPLVLGHYWDSYWGNFKGWVMRVATWQDYVASASEMNALTSLFSDPCYAPLAGPSSPIMFSCNT